MSAIESLMIILPSFSFKQWGYDLALTEFGDQVFTWQQYDEIVENEGRDAANAAQEIILPL
jgi:isocitrate dehydrogenase